MSKQNLIRCMNCYKTRGKQRALGAIEKDYISVLRLSKENEKFLTLVSGFSYFVRCGNCGEIAWERVPKEEEVHKFVRAYLNTEQGSMFIASMTQGTI